MSATRAGSDSKNCRVTSVTCCQPALSSWNSCAKALLSKALPVCLRAAMNKSVAS